MRGHASYRTEALWFQDLVDDRQIGLEGTKSDRKQSEQNLRNDTRTPRHSDSGACRPIDAPQRFRSATTSSTSSRYSPRCPGRASQRRRSAARAAVSERASAHLSMPSQRTTAQAMFQARRRTEQQQRCEHRLSTGEVLEVTAAVHERRIHPYETRQITQRLQATHARKHTHQRQHRCRGCW